MKARTFIFLLLILSLLLAGCGSAKPSASQTGTGTESLPQTVIDESTSDLVPAEEPAARRSESLPYTYQVPGKEIYLDVPASPYFSSEWGYSELYANGTERGIAITAIRSEETSGKTAKDIYSLMTEEYLFSMRDYVTADEIVLDNEQMLTINGMEVYRFEGHIQGQFMSEVHDLYTVGYTFVMQGIPCSIQGSVFYKEQNPDSVKEIRTLVDEMITTVRDSE